MEVLPAKVNTWLRQKEAKVKAAGRLRVKRSPTVTALIEWCLAEDLPAELCPGNSLQLPDFILTPALLEAIAQRQHEGNQQNFRSDLQDKSRLQQAQLSDQESKQQGLKPLHNRILIRLPQPQSSALGCPLQIFDLDFTLLALCRFARLILVETLDCFYQLDAFTLSLQPDAL